MERKPNFWFKASEVKLDFQADFDYMLYLNSSTLHKGMETIFGPGIKIKDKEAYRYSELSTYYKGENYGPTFEYSKTISIIPVRTEIEYNMYNVTVEERYEVKGRSIGKFRRPLSYDENGPGDQGYYIDSKRWFNYIRYSSSTKDDILGTEYWYVDGELQDFGRIIYKDKTYKFVKFDPSNKFRYEDVNKKEVDFKSYVDKELWDVEDGSYKAFVKEFKPNIKNKDIIIKITELKEDGELFATDIDIEIKDEVTTLRTFANPEEFGALYTIFKDSFKFIMRKERADYVYLENDEIIKQISIHHQSNYFQKYLQAIYDSSFLDMLRRNKRTVLGHNKIYSNISDHIQIWDLKLKKYEEYWHDKTMYFCNLSENKYADGKFLKIKSDGAVFEQFYDNGEEISDYEFVEYIKSIDEIDEF